MKNDMVVNRGRSFKFGRKSVLQKSDTGVSSVRFRHNFFTFATLVLQPRTTYGLSTERRESFPLY